MTADDFRRKIRINLDDAVAEARKDGDPEPSDMACMLCWAIVKHVAPHVYDAPRFLCGVFVEDTGNIALTLQSLETDRRVTFRIAPGGNVYETVTIDESGDRIGPHYFSTEADGAEFLARWVVRS